MNKLKLFVFVCSVVLYSVNCFCMNAYAGNQLSNRFSMFRSHHTVAVVENAPALAQNYATPTQRAFIIMPSTPGTFNEEKENDLIKKLINDMNNFSL